MLRSVNTKMTLPSHAFARSLDRGRPARPGGDDAAVQHLYRHRQARLANCAGLARARARQAKRHPAMTSGGWPEIERLYLEASGLVAADRAGFLDQDDGVLAQRAPRPGGPPHQFRNPRSEEHTSE